MRHIVFWIAIAILVSFLAMVFAFALIGVRSVTMWGHRPHSDLTLVKVSSDTGLRFGNSAALVHDYVSAGLSERDYLVVVRMRRNEVQQFTRYFPRDWKMSRTDNLGVSRRGVSFKDLPSWWTPDAVHEFVAAKSVDRRPVISLLIGLDEPRQATVYIHYIR